MFNYPVSQINFQINIPVVPLLEVLTIYTEQNWFKLFLIYTYQ